MLSWLKTFEHKNGLWGGFLKGVINVQETKIASMFAGLVFLLAFLYWKDYIFMKNGLVFINLKLKEDTLFSIQKRGRSTYMTDVQVWARKHTPQQTYDTNTHFWHRSGTKRGAGRSQKAFDSFFNFFVLSLYPPHTQESPSSYISATSCLQ